MEAVNFKWQSAQEVVKLRGSINDYRTRLRKATEDFKEAKAHADKVRSETLDVAALVEIGEGSDKDLQKAKARLEKAEAEVHRVEDVMMTLERVERPLQNRLDKVASEVRGRNRVVLAKRAAELEAEALEHLHALMEIGAEVKPIRFAYVENNEPEEGGRVPKTQPGSVGRLKHLALPRIAAMIDGLMPRG